MKYILLIVIKFYKRFISPILGSNCRFYPTCSSYAQTAIETHGAFSGSWLAIKRIARCQPLSSGGLDPVPDCNHNHT